MLKGWLVGEKEKIDWNSRFWNSIGGGLNAIQSAIILIFISHLYIQGTSGIVTFAYALGTLMLTIGKYGMRNYQVTDVNEKYSFLDYRFTRNTLIVILIGVSLCYGIICWKTFQYSTQKTFLITIIILYRLIDAWEDTYIGRYQQNGRLDIGTKILSLRMFLTTLLICILSLTRINITIIFTITIFLSVLIDLWAIRATNDYLSINSKAKTITKKTWYLLWETLPLCIGTTFSILIGNVPKYMINHFLNDEYQAVFGYIMMPVFSIMLLSTFIYMPKIKKMAELWNKKEYKQFRKDIYLQLLYVLFITVCAIIIGILLGIPILSFMYNISLRVYQKEFVLLLIGGGFYAMAYYLNVPITSMRYQKVLVWGYVLIAILSIVLGVFFVAKAGVLGASILYLITNMCLFLIYLITTEILIQKGKRRVADIQKK